MKHHRLSRFTLAGIFTAALLVACDKYENFPIAAPGVGNCEYQVTNISSEADAYSHMKRVVNILKSETLGSRSIEIISANVHTTSTINGVPSRFGFQIVFSCDAAQIKIESVRNIEFHPVAKTELEARLKLLTEGRFTKVLDSYLHDLSVTTCSRCCDANNDCADCNCTTDYEYGYTIYYALVNPNNPRQAAFLQAYLDNRTVLRALTGQYQPSVTDTLAVAKKALASYPASQKSITDWHRVLTKIEAHPVPAKPYRACNSRQTIEQPHSRHRVIK